MRMVMLEDIQDDMILAQDVFLTAESVSPFSRQGIVLTDYVVERMKSKGIRSVYVQEPSDRFPGTTAKTPKAPPIISAELRDDAIGALEDLFAAASISGGDVHESSKQIVEHLDTVVTQLVTALVSDTSALINISDLKSFDDYTYHHSLSVAVLSIAIGQYMGYTIEELNQLGMCAIMHDIGKTAIPLEIIRKTSRLDEKEFSLIKTHSTAGCEYLMERAIGDEKMWNGVLYHHEKVDGTGYPKGLTGPDIPPWSRIISVADVYDALTSNRPYRKPMQPSDALEYIMGGSGTSFDFDTVSALVRKVDLYPVGSTVELSDGRVAEVLDNDNQMRPIIRLVENDQILDLYRDRNSLSVVIQDVLELPTHA